MCARTDDQTMQLARLHGWLVQMVGWLAGFLLSCVGFVLALLLTCSRLLAMLVALHTDNRM
jgi:hypothetical protein